MKSSAAFLAVLVAAASLPLIAQPPPQPPPPPCTPAENVVCGQQAPEDLVALGPQWVAAGAYSGTGGVMLIRPGSTTHQVDTDQRALPLTFTAGSGQLTMRTPANGNIAPPGHYMLFIVNRSGVPSVARWVRLG